MTDISYKEDQVQYVNNFQDLVNTPFTGIVNAIGWTRNLEGDFSEIIKKLVRQENITVIEQEELRALQLTEQGQLARETLLADFQLLKAHGASPTLNIITHYDRDDAFPFFPTDVYSFHVDRSPIPTNTFLCTYYGDASEILPNARATQKIRIPEIRAELKKLHTGPDEDFESFLTENFFDLHYQPEPGAHPITLGLGHMWRLSVDHPGSKVPPCIHRAPNETSGKTRLLLIC